MKIILLGVFLIFVFVSPAFRCIVFNPHLSAYYGFTDLYHFFRYHQWRNGKCGELICYTGLFGKGKTLSAVHTIVTRYRRYNDKMVFDIHRLKWVLQRVVILSNVELSTVPYVKFENLNQIVELSHELNDYDLEHDTLTFLYVLGDEFSVQLNSRNFKTNINAQVLNSILTCRHYHMSLFYTAQRFKHVDALLRQVKKSVYDCRKLWRLQRQYVYDAYELENCTNPLLVVPKMRLCWFVRNKDYEEYDTLSCVDNLSKDALEGNMLSDFEILELQSSQDADTVVNTSRKAKRRKFHK